MRIRVVVELGGFLLSVSVLCRRQQDSEDHQDHLDNFFLGQYRSLHFLLMLQIEYIANAGRDTMKTRTPATGVLMSIILFTLFSRERIVSQCLLLKSFKCLVAVLFTLRTWIDYGMHQP